MSHVIHPPEVSARIDRLLQFHEQSKVAPPPETVALASQLPSAFRVFDKLPKTPLPTKLLDAPTGILKILTSGNAALPESMQHPPQTLQTLASWLNLAAGITGKSETPRGLHYLRAYPSAGALYPTEIYVLALGIVDLAPGLYHFSSKEFSLRKLRDGYESLAQLKRGRPDLDVLKTMPAILLVSSIFWRTSWKYAERGFRYATLDAGHVVENLVQSGAALGIPSMVRLHVNDRNTREVIGVPKDSQFDAFEAVQAFVAWADTADKPLQPPPVRTMPTVLAAIPRPTVSAEFTDYPTIREAHENCIAPGVGVQEVRPPHTERSPLPQGTELLQLAEDDIYSDMAVMQTLRKRRSIRQYTSHGISRDHFGKLNRIAFRGGTYYPLLPDGPSLGLVRPFWFIHNVTGVEPGLWYYHANFDKYTIVRQGDLKFEAKYLCCDQEFCSAGSALCVLCCDLETAMRTASPDAYRVAHLEAGIAVQRLYLACTAMYIDGCSVGKFRDDELRTALDLGTTDWQPIYAFAVGGLRRPVQKEVAQSATADAGISLTFKE